MMQHNMSGFPASQIFLNCIDNGWYIAGIPGLGCDVSQVAERLQEVVGDLRGAQGKTIFYGGSMGGYGALLYGSLLNVDYILATGVETILSVPGGHSAAFLNGKSADFDLFSIVKNSQAKTFLYYGEYFPPDLLSALHIRPALENHGSVIVVKNKGHSLPPLLDKLYGLPKIFENILSSGDTQINDVVSSPILDYGELVEAIFAVFTGPTGPGKDSTSLQAHMDCLAYCARDLSLPDNCRAHALYAYSQGCLLKSNLAQAKSSIEQSIELEKENFRIYGQAARCAFLLEDWDAAISHGVKSIRLQRPDLLDADNSILNLVVEVFLKKQDAIGALRVIAKEMKRFNNPPKTWDLYHRSALMYANLVKARDAQALDLFL